ncbi:MAG: response regulator transcription factor [Lachnospiraceae bacterium]|nr:response regulator transcription factor [Lachnospiraceae bacterium]
MNYDCLIVDDEEVLAKNTCEYFNMFEVKTKVVFSIAEAEEFFKENEASLLLLDINLGDGSGFDFCRKIRESRNLPILFISARNTDDDKIIALNIGGDDYVEKPYSLGVLLAKVRVVLKRYGAASGENAGEKEEAKEFKDGNITIDYVNKKVFHAGEEKKLTSLEYSLLKYLTDNKNRLLTKQELFDNVWNDRFTSDGTLNVHIRKLREAIEEDPQNPKRIITVWKEGYRYETGEKQ